MVSLCGDVHLFVQLEHGLPCGGVLYNEYVSSQFAFTGMGITPVMNVLSNAAGILNIGLTGYNVQQCAHVAKEVQRINSNLNMVMVSPA